MKHTHEVCETQADEVSVNNTTKLMDECECGCVRFRTIHQNGQLWEEICYSWQSGSDWASPIIDSQTQQDTEPDDYWSRWQVS